MRKMIVRLLLFRKYCEGHTVWSQQVSLLVSYCMPKNHEQFPYNRETSFVRPQFCRLISVTCKCVAKVHTELMFRKDGDSMLSGHQKSSGRTPTASPAKHEPLVSINFKPLSG